MSKKDSYKETENGSWCFLRAIGPKIWENRELQPLKKKFFISVLSRKTIKLFKSTGNGTFLEKKTKKKEFLCSKEMNYVICAIFQTPSEKTTFLNNLTV